MFVLPKIVRIRISIQLMGHEVHPTSLSGIGPTSWFPGSKRTRSISALTSTCCYAYIVCRYQYIPSRGLERTVFSPCMTEEAASFDITLRQTANRVCTWVYTVVMAGPVEGRWKVDDVGLGTVATACATIC